METLIISWYDSGYAWSIRFRELNKHIDKQDIHVLNKWFKDIKTKFEEEGTIYFINYVFKKYRFINTIIICEDGDIEVYDRKEWRD